MGRQRLALMLAGLVAAAAPAPVVTPGPVVLAADFPDPFLLAVPGGYLAYATNSTRRGVNVQVAASPDLRAWMLSGRDALPVMPPWARAGHTWAPEVLAVAGGYNLYFTARERRGGLQCVGVARAATPEGPFRSDARAPIVCQRAEGGSIDASPMRDADGRLYLHYKNDGNAVGRPTRIWGQALTPDGLALAGAPVALLANDAPWEGHVVEAPTMWRDARGYRLFYSANDFGWPKEARLSPYAIGFARCAGPLGPCRDAPENPVLASNAADGACVSGPGHQALLKAGGEVVFAYHSWDVGAGCRPATRRRFMRLGRLVD